MTLERFFTARADKAAVAPRMVHALSSLSKVAPEPFIGELTMRINDRGGAVYDGDKAVASIRQLHSLIVDPDYRGRGIGAALIVAWVRRNPDYQPRHGAVRTREGSASYRKAWRVLSGQPVRNFPEV